MGGRPNASIRLASRHPKVVLNLGSGVKTSAHPDVTNIDWSIYLRLKRAPLIRRIVPALLSGERRRRFADLPANILVHDLARGIPFNDASVDVVYHSHLLEHMDREVAESFMREVKRVLKPQGLQRIVVPDLERLCRACLEHLERCDSNSVERIRHDEYVAGLLEQSVRREAYGMSSQRGLLRIVEKLAVGDARRRGETHQWMYDWANLTALLERSGFHETKSRDYKSSDVPAWQDYGLDVDSSGGEYKPGSLYIEAIKVT